jgi:hypothetical protein
MLKSAAAHMFITSFFKLFSQANNDEITQFAKAVNIAKTFTALKTIIYLQVKTIKEIFTANSIELGCPDKYTLMSCGMKNGNHLWSIQYNTLKD